MTSSNNMDRDQAIRNVGPDLRSILFDTHHQYLLKTGCTASYNLEDLEILSNFTNGPRTFRGLCTLLSFLRSVDTDKKHNFVTVCLF